MIPTVSLPSLTSGALTAPKLLLTPLPALVASLLPSPGTTLHALPRPAPCISALRKRMAKVNYQTTGLMGWAIQDSNPCQRLRRPP